MNTTTDDAGRPKLAKPIMVIGDAEGDGLMLALTPPPFNHLIRLGVNGMERQRAHRLMRVAKRVYPVLQRIEARAIPDDDQALVGVPFETALRRDVCVERGLRMFDTGWRANIFRLVDRTGRAILPERRDTHMAACGLTVEQAQRVFIDMQITSVFKKNTAARRRLQGTVHDPRALSKIRLLSHFDPAALTALLSGFGTTMGATLATISPDILYAVATLKAYHLRALIQALGSNFKTIVNWDPETIRAIGVSFTCPEQIQDLGEAVGMLKGPRAITALGAWEVRDITERTNKERAQKGQNPLKNAHFETDIAIARKILGVHFNMFMVETHDVIRALGVLVAETLKCEQVERTNRIEEVRLFCDRYMAFVNSDVLNALGLVGDSPTTFGTALYVFEGLFTKKGLGRKFFETHLQTEAGTQAIRALMSQIKEMREKGSVKTEAEIERLIQNSDMLDGHIAQFLNFK